jgi:hypothetical protein
MHTHMLGRICLGLGTPGPMRSMDSGIFDSILSKGGGKAGADTRAQ